MTRIQTRNGQPAVYNATPPTLADEAESALAVDSRQNLKVVISSGANSAAVTTAGADASSNTQNALATESRIYGFNGTTWDRLRTAITTATSTFTGIINTFPLGKYNATPPTLTDGQVIVSQLDINGNRQVNLATSIAGEDLTNDVLKTEQRFSYLNIVAGQATTVVKSGSGFLHAIVFNGPATATNTTNVYDNTAASGTLIATPLATAVVGPVTVPYNCSFSTGLTIITATANGANMTIIYR